MADNDTPPQKTAHVSSTDDSEVKIKKTIDEKSISTITELINDIVKEALVLGTSDIHIEPRENDIIIRYRIDGLLRDAKVLNKDLGQTLLFKIKVSSKLRTDEHFAPQDGRISFVFGTVKVDTRISILPTTRGEKVVMRLLSSEGKALTLEDLGLFDRDLYIVQRSYQKPYGMILSTGPTGSGKTTSLYAMLKILNKPEINMMTVEDPVEYNIPGVNHIQINSKAGLSFATGLRSILRQDPNVIMVGEIRDEETARIAINAAMTGHMVLSTLHTNDAVTAIPRLFDMGIEPFLVATTLNIVIAQRLARRLCPECKTAFTLSPAELKQLATLRSDLSAYLKPHQTYYKATGCDLCGKTGYQGRVGLFEVLEIKKEIREIITGSRDVDKIAKVAREQGMLSIMEDGVKKTEQGLTTIDEIMRVTAYKE
ncbi:MAG: GspE/PulE family protein [bacterium]